MYEERLEQLKEAEDIKLTDKVLELVAIVMVNFNQPTGEEAWKIITDLIGEDMTTIIASIIGFSAGAGLQGERWKVLINDKS